MEEVNRLNHSRKKAEEERNHSLANKLSSIIVSRFEIMKRLYESRADLEQVLQSYLKLMGETKLKTSELKIKLWEKYKKINSSKASMENLRAIIDEILNTKEDTAKDDKKDDLIMDNIPDDLPDYLKEV